MPVMSYKVEQYIRTFVNDLGWSENPIDVVVKAVATAGQTSLTLSGTPNSAYPVLVYVNGVLLASPNGWTIAGAIITFVTALSLSDAILVFYRP